jgi:hypothetical protein
VGGSIQRRAFLASIAAGALAVALPGHGALQPFVTADYARLRRVLMHSPTLDDQIVYLTTGEPLHPMWLAMPPDVVAQHEQLVQLVRASGAEVLQVQDLLASAIREAKRQGVWRTWLSGAFPQFGAAADPVTEATLLSRDPRYQFQKDTAGNYHHVQDGLIGMCARNRSEPSDWLRRRGAYAEGICGSRRYGLGVQWPRVVARSRRATLPDTTARARLVS